MKIQFHENDVKSLLLDHIILNLISESVTPPEIIDIKTCIDNDIIWYEIELTLVETGK